MQLVVLNNLEVLGEFFSWGILEVGDIKTI